MNLVLLVHTVPQHILSFVSLPFSSCPALACFDRFCCTVLLRRQLGAKLRMSTQLGAFHSIPSHRRAKAAAPADPDSFTAPEGRQQGIHREMPSSLRVPGRT